MNTEFQVGQEVAIVDGRHTQFGYEVSKVTPSGQVLVVRKSDGYVRRFNKNRREIGKFASFYTRLHADAEALRTVIDRRTRADQAAAAIMAVRVDRSLGTYGVSGLQEQLAELEQLLETAKAAVQAIEGE